jgi:hypothetical protein
VRSHKAITCSVCDQFVHDICGGYSDDSEGFGQKVACNLCVRKNRINIEREGAKSGQEEQAQKVVSLSKSRLPAVDTRTNVVVRMPDVDRGRLAPRNVLAVVVHVNSSGHQGRPTWVAVCSHWVYNCWQQLHRCAWCALIVHCLFSKPQW